jgi:hypothetical protein
MPYLASVCMACKMGSALEGSVLQGLMDSDRHVIKRVSNPQLLSRMVSFDVAITIHPTQFWWGGQMDM